MRARLPRVYVGSFFAPSGIGSLPKTSPSPEFNLEYSPSKFDMAPPTGSFLRRSGGGGIEAKIWRRKQQAKVSFFGYENGVPHALILRDCYPLKYIISLKSHAHIDHFFDVFSLVHFFRVSLHLSLLYIINPIIQ